MPAVWFTALCLLLACAPWAPASAQARLVPDVDSIVLAPHAMVLEDPSGGLALEDVEKLPMEAFRPWNPASGDINFGYSDAAYWLRIPLDAPPGTPRNWLLEIAYPTLDHVQVHTPVDHWISGDRRPFGSRPLAHRNLVFPIRLAADDTHPVLHIRVVSEGSLTVPLTLWQPHAFDHASQRAYVTLSLYYGMLLALMLYNLLLYFSVRDANFLRYVLFVAAMAVGQLAANGFGNQFLWPQAPEWGHVSFPVGFAATGLFGALFTRGFLETARNTPRLDRGILALALAFALAIVLAIFVSYRIGAILTSLAGVSFAALAVLVGMRCMAKAQAGARWFLLAWALLLMGAAVMGMRNLGWLATNFFTTYAMQIGSALEMLMLSFALADRINTLRREKAMAQEQALAAHGALVDTLKDSERQLEERVRARTQELEAANAELSRSETLLRTLYNSSSDAVMLLDERGFLGGNPATVDMFGCTSEAHFRSLHPADLSPPTQACGSDSTRLANQHIATALAQGSHRFEWLHRRADNGRIFAADVLLNAMELDGRPVLQAVVRDITERKQAEEQVRSLAYYDSLTQLPNRRLLADRLAQAMSRGRREGLGGAVMFLDLDNFKPLNDTHGHAVGDLLLVEVARRLSGCVREMDTVARIGGDEFVVMLTSLSAHRGEAEIQANAVATKILSTLDTPYRLTLNAGSSAETTVEHHCTVSIGVTLFNGQEAGTEQIIKWADEAMYRAKEAGRNTICYH